MLHGKGLEMTMSRSATRSYEEVESHRKEAMTGEKKRSVLDDLLMLIFAASTAGVVYLLVVAYAGFLPTDYTLDLAFGAVAVLSLFAHRLRAYHPRHSAPGTLAFAFGDVLIFLGVMAAAAWVFVFPVLHPLPGETIAVGVFSLLLISAMVVILRFVQPITRSQPDREYTDIESSIRKLEVAVTRLSGRLPAGENRPDSATLDRLSAMMSELEAMRKEFATIRTSAPPPSSRPSAVVYSAGGVRASPDFSTGAGRQEVTVVRPASGPPSAPATVLGPPVPDSTVNNPWLDVLARRRTKQPQAKAPEQSEPPAKAPDPSETAPPG